MDQVFLNIKSERIWFLLFVSCRVLKVSELFSLKRVVFDCFPNVKLQVMCLTKITTVRIVTAKKKKKNINQLPGFLHLKTFKLLCFLGQL